MRRPQKVDRKKRPLHEITAARHPLPAVKSCFAPGGQPIHPSVHPPPMRISPPQMQRLRLFCFVLPGFGAAGVGTKVAAGWPRKVRVGILGERPQKQRRVDSLFSSALGKAGRANQEHGKLKPVRGAHLIYRKRWSSLLVGWACIGFTHPLAALHQHTGGDIGPCSRDPCCMPLQKKVIFICIS